MLVTDVLNYYQQNRFFNSKHDYQYVIDNLSFFYNHLLQDVEYPHLVDYSNLRLLKVKPATVNREVSFARASVNFYNRINRTEIYNPFVNFKLFEDEPTVRYLSKHEARKLLNAAMMTKNRILYLYLHLLILTGCRAGELLSLTWDNVYLDNRYFVVRNYFSKSKRTMHKPISTAALHIFNELKSHHHTFVFYNPETDDAYKSFSKGFRLAVTRAGLGKLRLHDLRHTFASWLVQDNVSLYRVQRILGHQDSASTQRYAHFANNDLVSAVEQIDLL